MFKIYAESKEEAICDRNRSKIWLVTNEEKQKRSKNSISPNLEKGEIENMKNITKRKDGRYQGYFTYNKKRYFVYDTNKKTCYSKLQQLKKQTLIKDETKPINIKRNI